MDLMEKLLQQIPLGNPSLGCFAGGFVGLLQRSFSFGYNQILGLLGGLRFLVRAPLQGSTIRTD